MYTYVWLQPTSQHCEGWKSNSKFNRHVITSTTRICWQLRQKDLTEWDWILIQINNSTTQILNSCFPETSWGLLHKFCLNPKCSFSLLPFFEHRYHIKMQTKMEYLLVLAWELTCCNQMVISRSRDYWVPVAWIRTCHHIHSSWYH
jgi:hypothetical protein